MEIERFDWFIERKQTRVAFGWLSERSGEKISRPKLSRNQSILRFDVILQHDWPIEQCLLHIKVFFGGKTKSPCFHLFIHWLIKQITKHLPKPFFQAIRKSLYLKRLCQENVAVVGQFSVLKSLLHAFTHTQLICYRAAVDLSTRYQTNSSGSTINHNDFFGEFAGIT